MTNVLLHNERCKVEWRAIRAFYDKELEPLQLRHRAVQLAVQQQVARKPTL